MDNVINLILVEQVDQNQSIMIWWMIVFDVQSNITEEYVSTADNEKNMSDSDKLVDLRVYDLWGW